MHPRTIEILVFIFIICGLPDISQAVDGGWSHWSPWTSCSTSCGQGLRKRFRECDSPAPNFGGRWCSGQNIQTGACKSPLDCSVDGQWSSWSKWSMCSVTCGDGGTRLRYRSCNNPPPSGNGAPCEGALRDIRKCSSTIQCPVHGQWSDWSPWTRCSVTCGEGERQRWRVCDNPPPQYGGRDCSTSADEDMQIGICNASVSCPVNGHWSEWSHWGSCNSPDCQSESEISYSYRQRSCNSPLPEHGGAMCQGTFLQAGLCVQPQNCQVDGGWSSWSAWSCTSSLAKRTRSCDNPPPSNGGKTCPTAQGIEWFSKDVDADLYDDACSDSTNDDENIPNGSENGSGDGEGIEEEYDDEDYDED